jgi:ribonucleotide monophosphatase NagD (HAD superfamily)
MIDNPNDFVLDISAEQQAFSNSIMSASEQMQEIQISQDVIRLPDSLSYSAANVDVSSATKAEASKVAVDLTLKFDPEEQYKELKETVDGMQKGIQEIGNNQHSKWIPFPRALNNFEEKPILEQTNLIFEERRSKFSEYPRWA